MVFRSQQQLYEVGMKKLNLETRKLDMQTDGNQDNQLNKANFLIQIQYRQNSSWQGRIVWLDTKKSLIFRSFLELALLMQEALQQDNKFDSLDKWELHRDVL